MRNRRIQISIYLMIVLLLAVNVSIVFAAPPMALQIEVLEYIGNPTPEPFAAFGAAVDDGLVCDAGLVEDLGGTSEDPGGPYIIMQIFKRFHCGDASGTFDVKMNVKLNKATGYTSANWVITGGTLSYTNLKGNGKLVGTPQVLGTSILDEYDGKVH